MEWYYIVAICFIGICLLFLLSVVFYRAFFKRFYDVVLSGIALVVLSPLLLILAAMGALAMQGNPFFTQKRIGNREKVFYLIKFRTMSNAKDKNGNLLPNDKRLNKYGRILRAFSLDELPELLNIFAGSMSIVGPRPLLPEYLLYYYENEHHRHDIRPGLTGLAQVNGRNAISNWEERFKYDLSYVEKYSLLMDISILFKTVMKVFRHSDVLVGATAVVGRLDEVREKQTVGMPNR